MRKIIWLTTILLLATNTSAKPITDDAEIAAACYLPTHSNVSYKDVTLLPTDSPSEVISYGPDSLQYGELWLPKAADFEGQTFESQTKDAQTPLLVFIHGGCWLSEYDIKHTHAMSSALAHAGYAVWSVEYRRTDDEGGGWPGSFNDAMSAIEFSASLERFGVDTNNTALLGHSAGGHLALLAGTNSKQIKTVIGLAAITDIEQYAAGENSCQTATPRFMGGTAQQLPEDYTNANPSRQARHPNTVLIHGNADEIVPLKQATAFSDNVRIIDGAGHFDLIHPGTPAFKALLKELANHIQ